MINDLQAAHINLSAARSRIEDTDMAKEISELTRNQIITQTSWMALQQTNKAPMQIVNLLRMSGR